MAKAQTSMRLSDETVELLDLLSEYLGIANKTAVVEMAVREFARARNIGVK